MRTHADIEKALDDYCARFPQTPEQRELLRHMLVSQREAVECEDHWQRDIATRHRLARATSAAVTEALRLEARGRTADQIERQLFDGIPPDISLVTLMRAVRSIIATRRPRSGAAALALSTEVAHARASDAAERVFPTTRAEAHAFGRNLTRSWLAAAGWSAQELSEQEDTQ